jgi:hypothetical protein
LARYRLGGKGSGTSCDEGIPYTADTQTNKTYIDPANQLRFVCFQNYDENLRIETKGYGRMVQEEVDL